MEGFAKLGIDLPSLVVQVVNFSLLLVLLYLFAYKPILCMMDKRSQRIKESMEQAESIKEQSARAGEEIKERLEAARREGQALLAQAGQMGDRLKEEARREARREAEALVHVVRCFEDESIIHVEKDLNPERDIDIVNIE